MLQLVKREDFLRTGKKRERERQRMRTARPSNITKVTQCWGGCIYTCRFHFVIVQRAVWTVITFTDGARNNMKAGPWKRGTLPLVLLISFGKFIGQRSGKLYDGGTMVSAVPGRVNAFEISCGCPRGTNVAWALCPRKQVVYAWAYSMPSKTVISAQSSSSSSTRSPRLRATHEKPMRHDLRRDVNFSP